MDKCTNDICCHVCEHWSEEFTTCLLTDNTSKGNQFCSSFMCKDCGEKLEDHVETMDCVPIYGCITTLEEMKDIKASPLT